MNWTQEAVGELVAGQRSFFKTGRMRFNLSLREHPYSGDKAKLKRKLLKFFQK